MNFIVMQVTQSCVVLECYLWHFVLGIYGHLEHVDSWIIMSNYNVMLVSIKTELIQTWAEISDVHPLTVNVVPVDILAASTDPLQCQHDHRHMMSECQTRTLTWSP